MITRPQLLAWIRRLSDKGRRRNSALTMVALRHANGRGGETQIERWEIEDDSSVDDIVDQLIEAMRGNTDGLAGEGGSKSQTYTLVPYFKDGEVDGIRNVFWQPSMVNLDGSVESSVLGTVTEPPTIAGHSAQGMRHLEIREQLQIQMMARLLTHSERHTVNQQAEIQSLRDQIRQMEERRIAQFAAQEDLLSRQFERDQARQADARQTEFFEQLAQRVWMLLPNVINKVTGKKLLPETQNPTLEMVKEFLGSFTKEQMDALPAAGIFTDVQAMTIMELYSNFQEQEEIKAAATAAAKAAAVAKAVAEPAKISASQIVPQLPTGTH